MSKNTIRGPSAPQPRPVDRDPDGDGAPGPSLKPNPSLKKLVKSDKGGKVQAPKARRPSRGAGHAGGAHGAGESHGAGGEHGEEGGGAFGAVEAADGSEDLHRHRSHKTRHAHHEEEIQHHEELHDTAATSADAVKRSKGGEGGGDGFDGRQGDQREAYERYMRGNVHKDQERFDELRKKGAKDDFVAERPPTDVEALGTHRATAHVVRLYERWTLDGVGREEAVQRAASFLAGFHSAQNIRKVLAELESRPIRDVYPLEVLMKMLDERPELLPGVRRGSVIGNAAELEDGKKVLAGYPATLQVPTDVRLKSFALLGGGRPGYELAPAVEEGKYTLLVDTPGEWRFAVLAAPLQQLGRIQRETSEAILEVFPVNVHAMGKKGEPLTPEEWRALQEAEAEDEDGDEVDGDDDDGAGPDAREGAGDDAGAGPADRAAPGRAAKVALAPPLPVQIRTELEAIRRDDPLPDAPAAATTYSWDASFYKPGAPLDGQPILHLVVERAGPFDPAWFKAREALAQKQREYEPGRATVTAEDFTAALRRARVR